MTTYNTGNPIGSTDARDLYDNAQVLDKFANGTAASYTDRLGVSRRSLAGIDSAADNVLNSIGYAVPVAYTSGVSLTLTSQTVDYNGVIYAPLSSALPFTTVDWATDSAKFRAIQVTDADMITYTPAGDGAVATNVQSKLRETVSVKNFGVVGDGSTDDTLNLQKAIDALGVLGSGRLTAPSGMRFKISGPLDFSVLGNVHSYYEIDFGGAEFTWYGLHTGAPAMFSFMNNKAVTVKNFTLLANSAASISATVKGIKVDSLQPDGADLLVFSDFRIRYANLGIDLGSVGADQNRVSDCRFEHFLLESCSVGVQTNSTNCDSLIFANGQLSGCSFGFNFVRAGFNKIDTCIGYACDPFIRVAGAIGPLTVINSQSEQGGLVDPAFFYRKIYTAARTGTITFIGCAIDNHIWLDYDSLIGSDSQRVNIVGGYFRKMTVSCPDTVVNLVGTTQTSGYTLTISGANTKCFNLGSRIDGSLVDAATPSGYVAATPEEGVFTPSVIGTSTVGSATYSARFGSYTRVGNTVFFQVHVNYSGGTGSGNLRISGLPFTSGNSGSFGFGTVTVGYASNIALAANSYLTAYVPSESSEIALANNTLGGGAASFVAYDGEGEILLSGQYKI